MNQFRDYECIFGKAEIAHIKRTMDEFTELATAIRRKLSKQGYLLDNYISMILEGMNKTLLYGSAEAGFGASSELRKLCISVMDCKTDCEDHPLYEKVKEYIYLHPLGYQEQATKLSLYCIALCGDFLEYAADQYRHRQKEAQRAIFDIVYLRDIYRQISALIDSEEQMERLNLLMRQRFLMVTPMVGFLQGLTNDLLYSLTSRDAETSKLTVQLWLDQSEEKERRSNDL